MFLFGGGKKTERDSVIAVFDIASSSVGGLLFKKRKNQLPEILSSVRQDVVFGETSDFSARWRVFSEAFIAVAKNLKSDFSHTPDSVMCVFSCPWFTSQTKLVKIQREKNFQVKKDLIKTLIEEQSDLFKKQWRDSVFFERRLMKTLLNGYEVENSFDKFSRNIELYLYLSLGMSHIEENLEKEIYKYLGTDKIVFHSFPFVAFSVLREILDTNEGFILADIAGELTDILLMRDGIIEEVNCFNKGENFFIRRLASAVNIDFTEAKAVFRQYQRAELTSEKSLKVGNVLKLATDEWGKSLEELLKKMSSDRLLPQNFYFCGSAGSLNEITKHVSSGDFSSFTVLSKPFAVSLLEPSIFKDSFEFTKGFSDNKDISLLMSSFFANKFVK
ncbi:MAG: hypothetical protein Q7R75_01905 [bacterium]|nr:hypothetical protein [bacterium]